MKRIGVASLLFIVSLSISSIGLAADTKKSESYLEEATKSLAKNDTKTALIQLKNAVQADPDNAKARYRLGVAQLQVGDLLSAEKELRVARERGYPEAEIASPLAETYLREQKYDLLLQELTEGDRPGEAEAQVRLHRGLALLALQRAPEAEIALEGALPKTKKTAPILIALARAKASEKDIESAKDLVRRAIDADPQYAEAWSLRGQLNRALGDVDAARKDLDKAIELEPTSPSARLLRAQLLIGQDERKLAQADVDAILKAQPGNAMALYLLAVLQAGEEKYRESELTLQKLGPVMAKMPQALFLLAQINLQQQQFAKAEDTINRYLVEVPDDPNGVILLSNVLLRRGNASRAVNVLQAASEKSPKNLRLLGALSEALQRNNQPDESAKVLDRIAGLTPGDASVLTQTATRRIQLGRLEDAVHDLQAASVADPKAPTAKLLLSLSYLEEKKLDEALKAAMEYRNQQPQNPMAENLIGVVTSAKDGARAAKPHFEKALQLKPDFIPAKMNLAKVAAIENNPELARQLFDEVLKLDPKREGAMLGQADLSFATGNVDDGRLWLEKARNAIPQAVVPRLRLAEFYLVRRDTAAAAEVGRELIATAPNDAVALRAAGRSFLANNEIPAATDTFQKLIEIEPQAAANQYDLYRALSAAKDTANARTALERALNLKPDDVVLQRAYVSYVTSTNNIESGLGFARRLNDSMKKSSETYLLVGDLLNAAGRRPEAIATYEEALKTSDNSVFVARIAEVQVASGDVAKAATAYDQWLAKHPNDGVIRFAFATLLLNQGQYERSLADHLVLLKGEPESPVLLNNVAFLYDKMGDSRSREFAEKAYKLAPDAPTVLDTLGWILVRMGEAPKALPMLEKAASQARPESEVQYHYAVALKESGKADEAREALQNYLSLAAKSPDADAAKRLLEQLKRR